MRVSFLEGLVIANIGLVGNPTAGVLPEIQILCMLRMHFVTLFSESFSE